MQGSENTGAAQAACEVAVGNMVESVHDALSLLLEVHMGISACMGCTYGMIAIFEDTPGLEMDAHTSMTCHGLKYILDQTDEVREKAEGILTKAIRPFLPPPPLG